MIPGALSQSYLLVALRVKSGCCSDQWITGDSFRMNPHLYQGVRPPECY